MATDGPDPEIHDQDAVSFGTGIVHVRGKANEIDRWVVAVAKTADARMDWTYVGGVGVIRHFGDAASLARANEAISAMASSPDVQILSRF